MLNVLALVSLRVLDRRYELVQLRHLRMERTVTVIMLVFRPWVLPVPVMVPLTLVRRPGLLSLCRWLMC